MKGLDSLIPDKSNQEQKGTKKESIFLIETEKIKPNPYQPRKEFKERDLKDLADSIKTYGVLQPLLVTKVEKNVPGGRDVEYELVAGERRLRAAELARLPRIPAVIQRSTNKEKLEVSLIENIQRDDLNAVEEAYAFDRLKNEFNLKNNQIAQKVGKSRSYIANVLRVLALPENIKQALVNEEISEGHTRPLLSLQSEKARLQLFNEIKNRQLNVRQAEKRAHELGAKMQEKTKARFAGSGQAKVDPELKEIVEKFKEKHNLADVRVNTQGRKANLAVHFSSKEDLREWIEGLLG